MVNKSRGRPSTPSDSRDRILQAARQRFTADGYTGTSLRAIARDADVDHALVSYYFGGKECLFRAVTELVFTPAQIFDAITARTPPDRFAATLLHTALTAWDRPDYQAGLGRLITDALTTPAAQRALREYLENEMIGRLAHLLGGTRAHQRAAAVASLISGLYFTRYILKLEPTASMTAEELTQQLAPTLQTLLHRHP